MAAFLLPPGGTTATDSSSGSASQPAPTDGGTLLAPAQPGDQFGLTPAVAPSTSDASVLTALQSTASDLAGVADLWGKEIPYLFGTCQVLGNPLWTGDATYITSTDNSSNLVVDFAVVFGRPGPNSSGGSIREIYFDGVPAISFNKKTKELDVSGDFDYVFYDGTQDGSEVDPLIDAREAPYTPAFIGMIYLVISQYVITNGQKKLPQVIGEIHLDEIATPTGGLVEPMAIANPRAPSGGYDGRQRIWWDSDRFQLYCPIPNSFGVHDPVRFDVYDTNAKQFLYQFYLEGSGDYFDTNYEISKNGDYIWYMHGFTDVYLCRLSDGAKVTVYNSPAGGGIQDTSLHKGVGGANEICILPTFGRKCDVAERRGASISSAQIWDFDDIGTGFTTSNALFGFTGILDYSTMNCDQNNFTVVYCLMEQGGSGWIGRIIHTSGDVLAGIAYLKDATTGAYHAEPQMVSSKIDLMHFFDGYMPFYLWVADNGRRVYALAKLNSSLTGDSYIFAFDTFWQTNNSDVDPRNTTDVTADLNKFELVYAKKLAGPVGTPNKGSQIRRVGQYKVAVVGTYGQSVLTVDLRSGRSRFHAAGDWMALPELGSFDYGNQDMPGTTIYDPDTGAIFYSRMATYSDLPGRLYLRNSAQAERATYRVADAFRDLSILAGYTADQIDVSGLDGPEEYITGMAINKGVNYQDLVAQLAAAFRVEITETPDFGIRFRKRHGAQPIDGSAYPGDMIGKNDGDDHHVIGINYAAANQIPNVLQLSYVDPDLSYLVGVQSAKRATFPKITATGKTIVNISIPVVMTADRAAYFAGTALFDMWAGAITLTITLPPAFIKYECGDNLNVYFPTGRVILCKIGGMTINTDRSITMSLSAIKTDIFVPLNQITDHRA